MENAFNNPPARPQATFRQCFSCNYDAVTDQVACPRCGKSKFFTSRNIRTRGIVLAAIGLFLVVFMGAIAVFVALMLMGSIHDPSAARRVNASMPTLAAIFLLFGLVIAFGLNSVVSGIFMAAAGRRSRILVWVMWGLLLVLLFTGGIVGSLVS